MIQSDDSAKFKCFGLGPGQENLLLPAHRRQHNYCDDYAQKKSPDQPKPWRSRLFRDSKMAEEFGYLNLVITGCPTAGIEIDCRAATGSEGNTL